MTTETTGSSNGAFSDIGRDAASDVRRYAQDALDAVAQLRQYLEKSDLETIRRDAEKRIRERPLTAVMVGLGVGFIVGKLLKD